MRWSAPLSRQSCALEMAAACGSGRPPRAPAAARPRRTSRAARPAPGAARRSRPGPAARPAGPAAGSTRRAAQAGQRRVAVRHHGGEAVHRPAQQHHHEAPVGRRRGQRQRGAAQGEGGAQPEQRRAAGQGRSRAGSGQVQASQRLWNSGEASSRVSASRREPARRDLPSVAALQQRAQAVARASCSGPAPAASGQAVGPVHPPQHRLRARPVGGAVRPADRERRVEHRLAQPAARPAQVGRCVRRARPAARRQATT